MLNEFQRAFESNLDDWCMGGPTASGWTRTGPLITLKTPMLIGMMEQELSVNDVLAKNRAEVDRWHLAFLEDHSQPCQTAYWNEYLMPRYGARRGLEKFREFLSLLESIRFGYNSCSAVFVADVESLGLGFRYFRFDGCHRTCCAKYLGMTSVPAKVFLLDRD